MRRLIVASTVVLLTSAPSWAQTERAYVTGTGGLAKTPDATSGDVLGEAGVRIAPHLLVFGDLGHFHNLQPFGVQEDVDNAATTLASTDGLDVIGTGRVPAWYSIGGLRYDVFNARRATPYLLGGFGFARLTPNARFTFSSGTLPDGSTPAVGDDVTAQVVSTGFFTTPPASTAAMTTLGGGVDVQLARHWTVDAGYRFSRVQADVPLNAQSTTFGFGYRF